MTERIWLSVHILRLPEVNIEMLRQGTIDTAQDSDKVYTGLTLQLLDDVYNLREYEMRLERAEIGEYSTLMKLLSVLINC